jgi:Flp pilus assembly protein TadD
LRADVTAKPGNLQAMSDLVGYLNVKRGLGAALDEADAMRANPANMPYVAAVKGDLLMALNKPDDASKAYAAELAQNPSEPLLMRLIVADAAAGRPDDSSKLLRDWLHDHPDSPAVALALSKLDILAKRYDDALAHLALVLKVAPNEPQALNNVAWVYYLTGDKRAREAAQQAYLKAPSPDSADTLGWIMATQGDAKNAVPLLMDASKQRPGDPVITYHLAAAMKADGQTTEAGKLLKAVLDSNKPFPERDAAQKLLVQLGTAP